MKKWLALLCAVLLPALALGEATPTPTLPMDFTPGHVADPANYTENGYEDETLSVTMERVWVGDAQFNVARVKIADPSQLRIGLAAPFGTKKTNRVSTIARDNNAVVAIGGDYFANEEGGYVVRMGEAYRKKPLKSRDMLVTDSKGNFHILKNSDATQLQALMEAEDPSLTCSTSAPPWLSTGAPGDAGNVQVQHQRQGAPLRHWPAGRAGIPAGGGGRPGRGGLRGLRRGHPGPVHVRPGMHPGL